MEDSEMDLERFVARFLLPHGAKVKEGIFEDDLEFACDEVIEIYRVVCPSVSFEIANPRSGAIDTISISTCTDGLRFHIVSPKMQVFQSVQEMIDAWPTVVETNFGQKGTSNSPAFQKGDKLRLIRTWVDDGPRDFLECKILRTRKLVNLPARQVGQFMEILDPRSYTLQELVDIARVERTLKVDWTSTCRSENPESWAWIPRGFTGLLKMRRPDARVEIARWLESDNDMPSKLGSPELIPIKCGILLSPRDREYAQRISNYKTYTLQSFVDQISSSGKLQGLPCVIRIFEWTEESMVLQNHHVRPKDHVVIYSRATPAVHKILAHTRSRYFLIPMAHDERFVIVQHNQKQLKLGDLTPETLPIKVRYTPQYSNPSEQLPENEDISFDALYAGDLCVVASKIFGDVVSEGFHLPLRTKIKVKLGSWCRKPPAAPGSMSQFDNWAEEISEQDYRDIFEETRSKAPATGKLRTGFSQGQAPSAPPREPREFREGNVVHSLPQGFKPVPPPKHCPSRGATLGNSVSQSRKEPDGQSSDDEPEYAYIDLNYFVKSRPNSAQAEKERPDPVSLQIPNDGNVSHFSAREMSLFLREMHVCDDVISRWSHLNGDLFSQLSDDSLAQLAPGNSIIRFFRDRSRSKGAGVLRLL